MGVAEIILIVACALIVVGVTAFSIIRKKKGKTSCGCGRGCCQGCSGCDKRKEN